MTIPFARDPRIHCIAFEPDPTNFDLLRRNIARNAADANVELHQVALFDKRSAMRLALADDNLGDHRLTLGGIPGRRTVEVAAVPLDDFLPSISGPLAVKIDTQGAEPFVVAGGSEVLKRADFLVMEFCPYLLRQLGGDPELVISLFSSFSSVALISSGTGVRPYYVDAQTAIGSLRDMQNAARQSAHAFIDIIAERKSSLKAEFGNAGAC